MAQTRDSTKIKHKSLLDLSWAVLERLGGVSGASGSTWVVLGTSGARLGGLLARLVRVLVLLGAVQGAATHNEAGRRKQKTISGAPGPSPLREKEPV